MTGPTGRILLLLLQQIVLLVSLQLVTGRARLLSLAQFAMAGVGAYTAARCALTFSSIPIAIVFGTAAGAATGVAVGYFCIRLNKNYVAFGTLAASEVFANLFRGASHLTGGVSGLSVPARSIAVAGHPLSDVGILVIHLTAALGAVAIFIAVERSRLGHGLAAQADADMLAESLGIDVRQLRMHAFGIAGALAGLSGVLVLISNRFISPDDFGTRRSIIALCFLLVAGLNKRWSFLVAAIIASVAFELLRNFNEWQMILLSLGCLTFLVLQSIPERRRA